VTSESERTSLRTALVSVGNELLFGETVDTNAAWLSRQLTEAGVHVVRGYTVPDDVDAIQRCVTSALGAADLVVLTGGLGPTRDDMTRAAVADLFGRKLFVDPERLVRLEERFRKRGFTELPEANVCQAEIPEGAVVLENPLGTAPGLVMDSDGGTVVLLPGVPREMKAIFGGDLVALLRDRYTTLMSEVAHRLIHTTGVPESRIADLMARDLPDLDRLFGDRASLAYLPDLRGVDLRISVRCSKDEDASEELDRLEALVSPVVAPWRFACESGDVSEAVLDALRGSGHTLAVAESCTAGVLAARLTEHPGASDVFIGGVVSYANEVKESLLGVPPASIISHGAVSEPVVRHMAEGVCRALGATIGLAITGVAGPGGGTVEKPVGTVWLAVSGAMGTVSETVCFAGDRAAVRERAAQGALALALTYVNQMMDEP